MADSRHFQMLVCCQPHGRDSPTENVVGRQLQGGPWSSRKGCEHSPWAGNREYLTTLGRKIQEVLASCTLAVLSGVSGLWGAAGAGQYWTVRLGNTVTPCEEEAGQFLTASAAVWDSP